MAQRVHMIKMVRRTGNMANKRNLTKPLVGRTLSFGFLGSPALDVVGDWDPGPVQILREYYHEHNRPEMNTLRQKIKTNTVEK